MKSIWFFFDNAGDHFPVNLYMIKSFQTYIILELAV